MIELKNGWRYDKTQKLGDGGQGDVYLAFKESSFDEYAIKLITINKKNKNNEKKKSRYDTALKVHKKTDHCNIIKYFNNGYIEDKKKISITL